VPRLVRRLTALALPVAALALPSLAAAPARAATACPSTFTVLHDDAIGKLKLPEGPYRIGVSGVSCATAADLFPRFLEDWDGKLPDRWHVKSRGVGAGTFKQTGGPSFTVDRTGSGGGGGGGGQHPTSSLVCAKPFTLLQRDRIGALTLKKGRYRINRLSTLSPSCGQAAVLLGNFLQDFDGDLPGGWTLLPEDGTFVNGRVSNGFRIEPYTGSGSGGRKYPTRTTRCRSTFRVQHNDRVGALRFPAGPYWISVLKGSGVSCAQASTLFAQFLDRPNGSLPKPWVVSRATGSFRRGKGSAFGFVPKPAFDIS
jgi:hypothetical protein